MNDTRPTITIRLKPHLQEFVISDLGGSSLACGYKIIGKLIRPFIQLRPTSVQPSFPKGKEYLILELPHSYNVNLRNNTYYISDENQKLIEILLDSHFKKIFYNYMKDKVRFQQRNFKVCIMQFCYDYDFCFENMNYEMLKKFFYRERRKENISNKFSSNPSRCRPDVVPVNKLMDFPFLIQ